ncbi:hypothetical protein C8256_15405 [Kluyvera genomosp. 2]|uniref:Uncharacterized protein n=1 Tax=Kluyvera genomosp. 2 TaxID=2774054 RepID=A0A2T2XZW5_9ENTR|nr:hypothetical protein C8256_15405 [Kluyvera genomosp. 2]
MHHGGVGVEIVDFTHGVLSRSLINSVKRTFSFSFLSQGVAMITEIAISGKAAKSKVGIAV